MERTSQFIRTITRPLLALGFGLAFIWLTYDKVVPAEAFVATATAVVLWWFKDRDRNGASGEGTR